MSSREFSKWKAFERIYGPITIHERLDILHSRSDNLLAEIHRDRKKHRKPFSISKFMPIWDHKKLERKPKDWRYIKEKMRAIAAAMSRNNANNS